MAGIAPAVALRIPRDRMPCPPHRATKSRPPTVGARTPSRMRRRGDENRACSRLGCAERPEWPGPDGRPRPAEGHDAAGLAWARRGWFPPWRRESNTTNLADRSRPGRSCSATDRGTATVLRCSMSSAERVFRKTPHRPHPAGMMPSGPNPGTARRREVAGLMNLQSRGGRALDVGAGRLDVPRVRSAGLPRLAACARSDDGATR